VKDERDLKALVQVLSDPEEDETVRHEIANVLVRSEYVGLQDALFRVLENPAEKSLFRGWAVQHLGKLLLDDKFPCDRQTLPARLRALLTDRHIEVRREALMALVKHNDPKAIEEVVKWLQAEGPEADRMRDLAIRCAHEKNMREHIPAIRGYARSTNDIIRIAAIVALSEWGDETSRPAFEDAAQSSTVRLRRCGQAALKRLDSVKSAQTAATTAD
jgi:HEAT repeat protein